MIYMAHEAEPRVLGRHFPSSRQFVLPAPLPVDSYEPPTVLSLSATDDWMFAYFPGKGGAGAGIVWQKEAQLDHWSMKELWEFPIGRGVVTAAWTCPHREVRLNSIMSYIRHPKLSTVDCLGRVLLQSSSSSWSTHAFWAPVVVASHRITLASRLPHDSREGATIRTCPSVTTNGWSQ